ncbi:putative bifunctional diguanylate cyclase/phosphodiesterase [Ideonella livida]|uniref:EAL domain-containing protein n=1 Tax=Ideonella livida TaxID=2707176 RepID=A0A7C9PF42_9BURK|nr:EAL domain-containing protein [Ideonella livida]NDY90169.1 EAL domain-containing protein [Ideonella livida]
MAEPLAPTSSEQSQLQLMGRRLERERLARKAAESLLTSKSQELYEALQQVRESERRLQMALWASGEGIWEWHADTQTFEVSGQDVRGLPNEGMRLDTEALLRMMQPEDRDTTTRVWQLHLKGQSEDIDVAYRVATPAGIRWLRVRGRALERDAQGRPLRVTGTIKDITGQRDAEKTLHMLAQAFASTSDALAVVDDRWQVVEGNQAMARLLGLTGPPALIGLALDQALGLAAPPGQAWRGEHRLSCGNRAEPLPVEITVTWVAAVGVMGRCGVVSVQDISERHEAARQLERLALSDNLTGLGNRVLLERQLAARLAGPDPAAFGLMFMDLDGFKAVNDSLGHRAGDELLRSVAARILRCLPQALVARWGGDEFVIVLPPDSDEASVREAAQVLIAALAQPVELVNAQEVLVSPSIGAVLCPQDGEDTPTLLRKADTAMYAAKERGKNCLCLYEPALEQGALRRVRLQGLLRVDAERSAFQFVAQPKVDAQGRHTGAELLMRWQTREFGAVSPAEFIPIAEQTGAIELLGRQALHTAARLARDVERLDGRVKVAVNLSPRQLQGSSFERLALHACDRYGVRPDQLELELTESALASGLDVVQPLLRRLQRHGFVLALDDFGTGYSSLSHLLHLPFNKVKIDRAFVKDLGANARAMAVVRGALQICQGLGMTTVAEGVETQAQFELLRGLGIHEFQGYLFSRPIPPQDWLDQLAQGRAGPPDTA